MSRSSFEVLRHILDELDYLLRVSNDLSEDDFSEDETLKRAFVRSLEIVGEAAKNIAPEVTSLSPEIEWRGMAGMRDRLIHGYFGVDYGLVWDVVANKVPILRGQIAGLVAQLETRGD
jgi:uncharacterized protein with HEPN domain